MILRLAVRLRQSCKGLQRELPLPCLALTNPLPTASAIGPRKGLQRELQVIEYQL